MATFYSINNMLYFNNNWNILTKNNPMYPPEMGKTSIHVLGKARSCPQRESILRGIQKISAGLPGKSS
jgi:hypothetical protein